MIEALRDGYLDVALLELKKADVLENDGPGALSYAIQQNDQRMVALLLAAGVSPNAPVEGAWYPMGEAARNGNIGIMCTLLDYNANVAKANERVGNLQMAISGSHLDAATLLITAGYRASMAEKAKAMSLAAKNGYGGILSEILKLQPSVSQLRKLCN